jgi:hypothetical protein
LLASRSFHDRRHVDEDLVAQLEGVAQALLGDFADVQQASGPSVPGKISTKAPRILYR